VQEYIEGKEYLLDMLVSEDGRLLCVVAKKVFEFSDGIPIKAVIEPRNELVDLAKKLCKSLKFFGVISVGTLIDKKDMKPKLIEINPRAGTSVILSVGAGCNLPLSAVYLALGKPVDPARLVPRSVYMSRYHEEIFLEEPSAETNIDTGKLSQFDQHI